jgi:predicted RNA binding protein YcfA (HicA-like mRNA interferase family)
LCIARNLLPMKSADIIKRLRADGWYWVHTVGSHHQFKHPFKPGKVTVPHPRKDLPTPTAQSILKQAGLK